MKRSLIVSAVVVLAVFLLLMFGFVSPPSNTPALPHTLLLVVEKDTGAFLMQLRQGVQAAVSEKGWEMETEMIDSRGAAESKRSVRRPDGVLLFMESTALREKAAGLLDEAGIPTVFVGTEHVGYGCVCVDERQAGEVAGAYAAAYESVYLLGGSDLQREGALSRLADSRVLTDQPVDPALKNACVVALDRETAETLAKEKIEGHWSQPLVCFDPAPEDRASWLENDVAQALVLPAPYAMGYQAAIMAMGGEDAARSAESRLVTRADMYDAQNIKLVFPLLH